MISLFFLIGASARAESVGEAMESLDLSAWQRAVDEAGGELNVASTIRSLAEGENALSVEQFWDALREILADETRDLPGQLVALAAPALLWAVNRQLSGRIGTASGLVCYLAGVGAMISLFSGQMQVMRTTLERVGRLSGEVFPALIGLMNATGSAGTANLMEPLAVFVGGAMVEVAGRIGSVLAGGAAVLAAAGNLSDRIRFKGLQKLCCSAGGWIQGGILTAFLGLSSLCGVMGKARDGASIRAAKYAADNLLPVVGGEVADTVDAMASSLLLIRNAAGVTGVIALAAICLRPVLRLAAGMLAFRLAAAIAEPVSDGPLKRCLEQLAQASQLLLATVAACMSMFVSLIGVVMGGAS